MRRLTSRHPRQRQPGRISSVAASAARCTQRGSRDGETKSTQPQPLAHSQQPPAVLSPAVHSTHLSPRCVVVVQWFAVAFLGHWVGLIAIASVYGPKFVTLVTQVISQPPPNQTSGPTLDTTTQEQQYKSVIAILCVAAIIGAAGAGVFLWIMKRAQGRVVKASLALNLLIDGIALIVCFALGATPVAIIFLVYFVILCIWSWVVRNRIPFAEAVLTAASHVSNSNTTQNEQPSRDE